MRPILAALVFVWLSFGAASADMPRESLAGQLLVARDSMPDPRFAQSVIVIIRDDEEGTLGLIVNRPIGQALAGDIHRQLGLPGTPPEREIDLYLGGPVQPGVGLVIHSGEFEAEDTIAVPGGIAVSRLRPVLAARAAGNGPLEAIFTFGYAGWDVGQLDAELARNDWDTVAADLRMVFETPPGDLWRRARELRGLDL